MVKANRRMTIFTSCRSTTRREYSEDQHKIMEGRVDECIVKGRL